MSFRIKSMEQFFFSCKAFAIEERMYLQNRQVSSPLILLQPDSIGIAHKLRKILVSLQQGIL